MKTVGIILATIGTLGLAALLLFATKSSYLWR